MNGALRPSLWCTEADTLAGCVNAGVGPAGSMGNGSVAEDAFEDPLEFGLHRAAGWLTLPPDEAGTVVV
jgi:hypothetical protein